MVVLESNTTSYKPSPSVSLAATEMSAEKAAALRHWVLLQTSGHLFLYTFFWHLAFRASACNAQSMPHVNQLPFGCTWNGTGQFSHGQRRF